MVAACKTYEHYLKINAKVEEDLADEMTLVDCPYQTVNTIIYGSIDYSAHLGFLPHTDFLLTRGVLGPREEIDNNRAV